MKKFTLYLGLNDKDTKRQEIATLEAYKITTNLLTSYTDGATILKLTEYINTRTELLQ